MRWMYFLMLSGMLKFTTMAKSFTSSLGWDEGATAETGLWIDGLSPVRSRQHWVERFLAVQKEGGAGNGARQRGKGTRVKRHLWPPKCLAGRP